MTRREKDCPSLTRFSSSSSCPRLVHRIVAGTGTWPCPAATLCSARLRSCLPQRNATGACTPAAPRDSRVMCCRSESGDAGIGDDERTRARNQGERRDIHPTFLHSYCCLCAALGSLLSRWTRWQMFSLYFTLVPTNVFSHHLETQTVMYAMNGATVALFVLLL